MPPTKCEYLLNLLEIPFDVIVIIAIVNTIISSIKKNKI